MRRGAWGVSKSGRHPYFVGTTGGSSTSVFGPLIEDLGITMSEPIPLAPGDIFAVISDGVFEARNPAGKRFGIDRVVEVITSCRGQTPTQILVELREIVAAFTKEAPATDDRTAIIIKRVAESEESHKP